MRVLSVIRQVLDADESVRIHDGQIDLTNSKLVMDTMDEYGLEEALRMREKQPDVTIIVLAVGASRNEEVLRSALALGADRAILVETTERLDVMAVSSIVAKVAQREQVDVVITGGQQVDWDSQALGAATAERLGWSQVTWATHVVIEEARAIVTHDVDEAAETVSVALPIVLTTQQGLNEPRYPTLPNIMKAKKKELTRESAADFGVTRQVKFLSAEVQMKQRRQRVMDGSDPVTATATLLQMLREEAKVLV